jgi:hypothetical protein
MLCKVSLANDNADADTSSVDVNLSLILTNAWAVNVN